MGRFLLLTGALLVGVCVAFEDVVKRAEYEFVNEYDQPFDFKCKEGESIDEIATEHDNYREDRRWDFTCKKNQVITKDCTWSGEVNNFDQDFDYKCEKGVIAGIASHHDNHYEDRRFKFYCCKVKHELKDCLDTDWVNNWDERFTVKVAKGMAMVGMSSIHKNYYDDRRFKLHYCKVPSHTKPKPTKPSTSTDKGEVFCKRYKPWCNQISKGGRWSAYMKKYCGESCKKFQSGTSDKGDKVCRRFKRWCHQIEKGGSHKAYMKKHCALSCKKYAKEEEEKSKVCVDKVTDCRAFRKHCLEREIDPVYTNYVKKNCCKFCKEEAEKAKQRARPYYG